MIEKTGYDFDYIIIGSGFGGSVSALRLAEKGYRVCVLEKGRSYRTDDFPKTNWNLRKFTWLPALGLYGIQVLTLFRHVLILSGAGVGGGSLVYANQLLTPPDEVFARPEWGPGDWKNRLAPHYQTARTMLGAVPCPRVGRADRLLAKIGREIRGRDTFHLNEVGVYFGEPDRTVPDPYFNGRGPSRTGCTFCGACMIGCPVGAKNTLDKNYLYLAQGLGAEVRPETEAVGVVPLRGGYRVEFKRSIGLSRPRGALTAQKVIFSGGVLGSVKLLLKCKTKGLLPGLSDRLGHFVRTNSEALLTVTARDRNADYSDQLAITSGIYADETTHIEIVRYNKGSDAMSLLVTLLTGGGGRLPRGFRFLGQVARHPLAFVKSLWIPNWAARTPILLVMQTDDNHIRLTHKRRWWRLFGRSLNSELAPGGKKIPSYIPIANQVARGLGREIDGQPMSSWTEALFDISSTAHILGGAVMGEDKSSGVTDFKGRVHGYPGLYVVDGSSIPVNLGVNPSLTITALAEYVMSHIPARAAEEQADPTSEEDQSITGPRLSS